MGSDACTCDDAAGAVHHPGWQLYLESHFFSLIYLGLSLICDELDAYSSRCVHPVP